MLIVTRIYEQLEQGATVPLKCRLDDGELVVVKYPKNRCGTQVLINEIVGAALQDKMGIRIPDHGLCYLSKDVIESFIENDENSEIGESDIGSQNAGVCVYSKLIRGTTLSSELLRKTNKRMGIENVLVYDCFTNNTDRHEGNAIISEYFEVYAIDNSHIIDGKHFEDDKYVQLNLTISLDSVLDSEFYTDYFEIVPFSKIRLNRAINNLKGIDLNTLLRETFDVIPQEWLDNVLLDYLQYIRDILLWRQGQLDEIRSAIMLRRSQYDK